MYQVRLFDPHTIRWWYNRREVVDTVPPYQRKGALWSLPAKQLLIDSILNEFDVPKLYFADFTLKNSPELNPNNKLYAVVDGKQRFEAIVDFIEGRLTLAEDFVWLRNRELKLGGLSYADLVKTQPLAAEGFDDYILTVVAIVTDEVGMINNQFIRLNSSKPLSGAELRNAIAGPVSEAIRDLLHHPFFRTKISFKTDRGADHNLATKLLLLEFVGRPTETKKSNLDTFVRLAKNAGNPDIEPAVAAVTLGLNQMTKVFSDRDALLKQAGAIPAIYWFIRGIEKDQLARVRSFLVSFELDRVNVRSRMLGKVVDMQAPKNETPYMMYNTVLRSVDDASSIGMRAVILERLYREWCLQKDGSPVLPFPDKQLP